MLRIVVFILAALYPVLVFCFLIILKIPLRYFSVFVLFTALAIFLGNTSKNKAAPYPDHPEQKSRRHNIPIRVLSTVVLGATGLACLLSNQAVFIKLYPVLMNAIMLCSFGFSLLVPPPMIFRFATLADKSIRGSLAEKRIEKYCFNVTLVWCAFFILNGGIALWTVLSGSDVLWSVYNGGISYVLIGSLFAVEFLVRKIIDRKMPRAFPLSAFKPDSRLPDHVLCYQQSWADGVYKTWKDYLEDTARLRIAIVQDGSKSWILHAEDCWYFLCAITALLQCGREIHLTEETSPACMSEIRAQKGIPFLSDLPVGADNPIDNALHIPSILESPLPSPAMIHEYSPIIAEDTRIFLHTSGTAEKPKIATQRLEELENDNKSILSKYAEEYLNRKVCGTVSHHHIYGLLFMILLPFTAGVPFRRRRIEDPKEFEVMRGDPLLIVSEPVFLKRAAEQKAAEGAGANFGLLDPWIFTSRGIFEREAAEKIYRGFGFLPLEPYSSTVTTGTTWQPSDSQEQIPYLTERILTEEKVLEHSGEKAVLEFTLSADCDYYNEHFSLLQVLPGIAQFEMAVRFANKYLGSSLYAEKSKRLKFTSLIRPGTPLKLELSKKTVPETVESGINMTPLIAFTFSSPDGKIVYSSGTFSTGTDA